MPRKSNNDELGLSDAAIEVIICGHNFFHDGGEFGPPPAPFRDKEHLKQVWFQIKEQFLKLIEEESEVNRHNEYRFRGMYLPWGPKVESCAAYWWSETDETMPWPRPPTYAETMGK